MTLTADELRFNTTLVRAFQDSVDHCNFDSVVLNLTRIKERRSWEVRYFGSRLLKSESFRAFICDPKPHGCGWDLDKVPKLIQMKIDGATPEERGKLEELRVWYRDMVTPGPGGQTEGAGRPRKSASVQASDKIITDIVSNDIASAVPVSVPKAFPRAKSRNIDGHGNSRSYIMSRLAKQRPDLFNRVKVGELSSHAAAVEAGFVKPTLTIPCSPEGAAAALKRRFTPAELQTLMKLLSQPGR